MRLGRERRREGRQRRAARCRLEPARRLASIPSGERDEGEVELRALAVLGRGRRREEPRARLAIPAQLVERDAEEERRRGPVPGVYRLPERRDGADELASFHPAEAEVEGLFPSRALRAQPLEGRTRGSVRRVEPRGLAVSLKRGLARAAAELLLAHRAVERGGLLAAGLRPAGGRVIQ